jgi:hypothetical protein
LRDTFGDVKRGFIHSRLKAAAGSLKERGFDARCFDDLEEAVKEILEVIPADAPVGVGGSVTIRESGILEELSSRGNEVVSHSGQTDFHQSLETRKKAIACPFYLCSSNAITMEGELVNTDGIGNRVSGMVFGPDTVIVLAGSNKLVSDITHGLDRIRNVAAPANARRLGIDVPCVEKGFCVNCRSPMNICRVTTIISRNPMATDLKVFLAPETLGL